MIIFTAQKHQFKPGVQVKSPLSWRLASADMEILTAHVVWEVKFSRAVKARPRNRNMMAWRAASQNIDIDRICMDEAIFQIKRSFYHGKRVYQTTGTGFYNTRSA